MHNSQFTMHNLKLNEGGRIPELRFPEFEGEWEEKKLEEILEFKNGVNASAGDYGTGIKFINVLDILENRYITYENIIGKVNIDDKKLGENEVNYGDILFQRSSETREEVGMSNVYLDNRVATFGGFVIRGKKISEYDPIFMNLVLRTDYVRKQMEMSAGGSTRFNIGQNELKKIIYIHPCIKEQEKIGNFFYKIDERIELQQTRIETLKEYKKGMMQKIFSQEIRFKDENGKDYTDWEEKKLGEILKESNIRKNNENYRILSSTVEGIYYQDEYFKNRIASEDTSSYKILRKGQIVFSPQNIWMGNINFNKDYDIGVVSPSYKIYDIDEKYNKIYISYIIKLPELIYEYKVSSEQGASTVRRNLNIKLFSNIKINLPSLPEQNKIANFLSSIDKKIELEEEKLEKQREFKKGLMQKMFI